MSSTSFRGLKPLVGSTLHIWETWKCTLGAAFVPIRVSGYGFGLLKTWEWPKAYAIYTSPGMMSLVGTYTLGMLWRGFGVWRDWSLIVQTTIDANLHTGLWALLRRNRELCRKKKLRSCCFRILVLARPPLPTPLWWNQIYFLQFQTSPWK